MKIQKILADLVNTVDLTYIKSNVKRQAFVFSCGRGGGGGGGGTPGIMYLGNT